MRRRTALLATIITTTAAAAATLAPTAAQALIPYICSKGTSRIQPTSYRQMDALRRKGYVCFKLA